MSDSKFNLNAIWRSFSQTGNETLSISIYNGSASFVMFKKGAESRRPVAKTPLSLSGCIRICDIIDNLENAQPETRMPYVQLNYNRETRQTEQAVSYVFFKDDKRCYGIEVSSKQLSTPVKFMLHSPGTFSAGSEPLTDEQRSLLALRELKMVLQIQVPQATLLSRLNLDPMAGRSGGRGGNYANRGGQSGSRDPYANSGSEGRDVFS